MNSPIVDYRQNKIHLQSLENELRQSRGTTDKKRPFMGVNAVLGVTVIMVLTLASIFVMSF